jgi:hypothetical protein
MAKHEIINSEPVALYILDAPPHVDRSVVGSPNLSVSNTLHQVPVFNGGRLAICPPQFDIPSPVEDSAWSVSLVAKTISNEAKLFEFASSNGTGLRYEDGVLYFSVRHVDGTITSASTPHKFISVADIYCTKGIESLSLYIGGELKASASIETTSPAVVGSVITIGDASSDVFAGNFAVWDKQISSETILNISRVYRRYPYRKEIGNQNSVMIFTPELMSFDHIIADYMDSYSNGTMETSKGTYLSGIDEFGLSVTSSVVFNYFVQVESNGVAVSWSDDFLATVEYSVDAGSSWLTLARGRIIPETKSLSEDLSILIRVSFASGSATRPFISDFKVIDFPSSNLNPLTFSTRVANLYGDFYIPQTSHHLQLHGDGLRLFGDGVLEIAPDDSGLIENTESLEFVFAAEQADLTGSKFIVNSSPEHTSSVSLVAGKLNFTGFAQVYLNGTAVVNNTVLIKPGLNYHVIANYTSANNSKITFGSEGSSISGPISTIAPHLSTFTSQQALDRFNAYLSYPVHRPLTSSLANFNDVDVSIYAKDWTTKSA